MNRIVVIGIIFLFVAGSVVPISGFNLDQSTITSISGNTLYVGGDGPGNYSKIQKAIDDANDGDTVFVYDDSSPYYENVVVDKSINLIGENRDTTIIDANSSGCPVDLEANNVIVNGFTLQNSGNKWYNDAGIHFKNKGDVPNSNRNRIIGNKMINNYDGIFGIYSVKNYISDNIIINNRHCGIYFQAGCQSNIIQNNTIMGNDYGVSMEDSNYVKVIENTIDNNNKIGVHLFAGAEFNSVKFNIITNNSYGISLDAGPYGAGWNYIFSNTIANNSEFGLYLFQGYWCIIYKNNFIGNNVHTSFHYILGLKIIAPFFGHFFQMNKFFHNYWDDHLLSTPKVIKGEMECFQLLYVLDIPIEPRIIKWINFDWFPAQKPFDIGM